MALEPKSGNFDFISAANTGYRLAWKNRLPLLRLMVLPFFIKVGCIAAILFLGFENQILRHGLVMIPAYFAEGFLVAYVIRTLHAGGDLGDDVKQARRYFDDVIAAMIVFVLIQLTLAFIIGYTITAMPEMSPEAEIESTSALQGFLMAVSVLAFMLWAFRFAWLHLPIAMGIPLSSFLSRIQSFSSSIPMLGCWLAIFLPMAFLMVLISQGISSFFPIIEGEANLLSTFVLGSFQGGAEIVINVIAGIAMSYGFKSLMEQK